MKWLRLLWSLIWGKPYTYVPPVPIEPLPPCVEDDCELCEEDKTPMPKPKKPQYRIRDAKTGLFISAKRSKQLSKKRTVKERVN